MAKVIRCFWIVLGFVLVLSSCKPKTKDGNFTLQLKAKYGDQNFAIHGINTDPQGRRIQIDNLKFYLSHIKLVKNDNSEVELKQVILCDFEDPTTLSFNLSDINGDFKAVKFSCGVDSAQNETDPLTLPRSEPLSGENNMYWSWLKYQFQVLEARCDTTSGGAGAFNLFARYHIGGNALYRSATISKSFSVCCDNKATINLVLDVKRIFYGPQTLDISTEFETQSGASDNPVIAPKFVDNFSAAFSIE
jgi:hypothetical protein